MANPSSDSGDPRSPLDSVLNTFLPQGHEKALKQAFYNAATILFIVLFCGAAVAVYFVLEIFIKPLLWAVLCGTVLYPFKYTLTSYVSGWLQGLEDSGTPLVVGTVAIPLSLLNFASEQLGQVISQRFKLLAAVSLGLPLTYLAYQCLDYVVQVVLGVFHVLYEGLGYFSTLWVWTIIIAYLLLVIFWWNDSTKGLLGSLSVPVWIILLLHLANLTGPFRVLLFVVVITLVALGYSTMRRKEAVDGTDGDEDQDSSLTSSETEISPKASDTSVSPEAQEDQAAKGDTGLGGDGQEGEAKKEEGVDEADLDRPSRLDLPQAVQEPKTKAKSIKDKVPLSTRYLLGLFWTCVLVRLWMHMWLLQLLPIPIAIWLLKRVATQTGLWDFVMAKVASWRADAMDWVAGREDAFIPPYIRGLTGLFLKGDRMVIGVLQNSVDKVISIVLILGVMIATVIIAFLMAIQIQQESMYLIQLSGNLVNETIAQNPDLQQWFPGAADMQQAVDTVLNDAYHYGRDWISQKVQSTLGGDDDNKEHIEEQVLELWDRLYAQLAVKNGTGGDDDDDDNHRFLAASVDMSWNGLRETMGKLDNIEMGGFVQTVQDNLETVKSVLESIWTVLISNVSILFTILTALLRFVFEGSTALLNFIISFLVFVTTLFYLLSSSRDQFLPMKWISGLTPAGPSSSKYSSALETAIRDVLGASIKMSAFYGLYTWLTHTLFGIKIVFIPTALAAILGFVPFLGTYWAAIPGVIDLLVQGERGLAIFLLVCHFIPMSVVDTAIYSDIKGGGHPYLTALSVAGGIFYFGLEGALIGPILLCGLLVVVNIYSKMMQGSSSAPSLINLRGTSLAPQGRMRSDTVS
ncbi:transmembrane protein 245-like isoform X2 [Acanthaster planci]|uniref:Transmembrane protein 245-like isoform X2 n=1 Tax=Acanthaster planci TaxID=133434 RepID=A0A8B7YA13_ACAPL|nr:transmembrane protein 245-like isoform X2 [Acanthaster planci]